MTIETQNVLEPKVMNLIVVAVEMGKMAVKIGTKEEGGEVEEATIITMMVEEGGTTIKEDGEGVVEGIISKEEEALVDFNKEGEGAIISEGAVGDMEGVEEYIECHIIFILGKSKFSFPMIFRMHLTSIESDSTGKWLSYQP